MSIVGSKFYILVIDVICIMRVYALYGFNRRVLLLLSILTAVEIAVGVYCVVRITDHGNTPPVPKNDLSAWYGCGLPFTPTTREMIKMYIVTWIFGTGTAATFFTLTVYKLKGSISDERGKIKCHIMKDSSLVPPLLIVFIRDGALNFLLSVSLLPLCIVDTDACCLQELWPFFAWVA
ncbi:hypothetical protein H1R20_g12810, partial [Candolleomyces eurysporus]